MDKPVFDGAAFVSIDLNKGQVSTKEHDRLALLPTEILSILPPDEALWEVARGWGETHGRSLGNQVNTEQADVASLASHLGGTLAAFGMGRVVVEIRHSALMFRVTGQMDDPGRLSEGLGVLLSGFLSGYLQVVAKRPFQTMDLGAVGGDRLFWAANPAAIDSVKSAMAQGQSAFEAIDALAFGEASC